MLYSSETWRTKHTTNRLHTFINICLSGILNICWTVSNVDLWKRTSQDLSGAGLDTPSGKPVTNIDQQALKLNSQGTRKGSRSRTTGEEVSKQKCLMGSDEGGSLKKLEKPSEVEDICKYPIFPRGAKGSSKVKVIVCHCYQVQQRTVLNFTSIKCDKLHCGIVSALLSVYLTFVFFFPFALF